MHVLTFPAYLDGAQATEAPGAAFWVEVRAAFTNPPKHPTTGVPLVSLGNDPTRAEAFEEIAELFTDSQEPDTDTAPMPARRGFDWHITDAAWPIVMELWQVKRGAFPPSFVPRARAIDRFVESVEVMSNTKFKAYLRRQAKKAPARARAS